MLFVNVFILILLLCFSHSAIANPDWYVDQDLKPSAHYIHIGYGSGETIEKAKQVARADIAAQLSVTINATMELNQELNGEDFTRSAKRSIQQKTQASLNNTKVLKSEKNNDQFFIALEYKHLSISQEFSSKVKIESCDNQIQHPYLIKTPLFQEFNSKLPCHLNITLVRKNRTWMLEYKDILVQLHDGDFIDLYTSVQSDLLRLSTPNNRIFEGDKIKLTIESKSDGYVSLFNVYADGMVSLLQENILITGNSKRIFPNDKDKITFEAGLLEKGKESLELYVGVFSKTSQDYTRFKEASSALIDSNESQYKFHNLLQLMKAQNFSATMVRILPEK